MASQKAASFSLSARIGCPVALLLAISLILPTQTAEAAESLNTQMYLWGEQTCQQVLDSGASSTLGGIDYRSSAEKLGLETLFCHCVGTAFMHYAPNQSARLDKADDETARAEVFAEILKENLNMCLNPDSFLYVSDMFGGDYDPWVINGTPPGQEEDE